LGCGRNNHGLTKTRTKFCILMFITKKVFESHIHPVFFKIYVENQDSQPLKTIFSFVDLPPHTLTPIHPRLRARRQQAAQAAVDEASARKAAELAAYNQRSDKRAAIDAQLKCVLRRR
jgi:hypothetical protein